MARVSLYVLIVCDIGRIHELFDFLAPVRIVLVAGWACIFLTILMPPGQRQPVLVQREVRIVLALVGLATLLLPFSVWPGGSLSFLLDKYYKVVALFILIVALATDQRVIRNLVWAVLIGVGLLGVFTLRGDSIRTGSEYMMGRASAGVTYSSNDVALMMVCALPLAALGALAFRGGSRLIAGGVTAICITATIMTVSRGGFIGLAFVSVLLVLRMGSAAARFAVIAVMIGLFAAIAPLQYWDVMDTIWNPTGMGYVGRGISSRVELWERGIDLVLGNPLVGVGIGVYYIADGLQYGRERGFVTAHNSFLQVAGELGTLGFALFVAMLVVSVHNVRRTGRAAKENAELGDLGWIAAAVEMSLYGYIVVGFALSQAYAPMLYFLVGMATALRLQVETSRWGPTAGVLRERLRSRAVSAQPVHGAGNTHRELHLASEDSRAPIK
jgi:O-antigen ligase